MAYHQLPNDIDLKPILASSSPYLQPNTNNSNQSPDYTTTASNTKPTLSVQDLHLKTSIRILKLFSRILSTLLSAATLAPLIQTLIKFFRTKDIYYALDNGQQRTAWAHDTITWYTYMYTAVSAISLLLNFAVLVAYIKGGVKGGKKAAAYSSGWSWFILVVNVIVWAISVGIYRYGKEAVDGKFRDLWGWTCSTTAKELQDVLTDVDFEKYCGIQITSFYTGIANVVTTGLSGIILILSIWRWRSKRQAMVNVDPLCL